MRTMHLLALTATAILVGVIIALASTAIQAISLDLPQANASATLSLPGCENDEDSIHCVWVADTFGNGIGRSYRVNRQGEVKYISHAKAHAIWNGAIATAV